MNGIISQLPRRTDVPLGALVPVAFEGANYAIPIRAFVSTLFDIRQYGAVTTDLGGTLNTTAIQNAALAAHAAGGGIVYIPAGTWWVTHGSYDPNVVCQINGLSRVVFAGEGVGVTRLKLVNGGEANFFNLTGAASYITIRDMELDGNRANQTLGVHGIRGDAFSGLWVDRCHIHDTFHYGIGIEGFVQEYLFFSNLKIENVGGDGFDQKNKADANLYQCATNVTVTNFGLNTLLPTQAGWDCRGAWQMSNYVCHYNVADGSGIRFRNGETGTPVDGGFGGHRSHISNVEIYGPGAATTSTGIEAVARDCVVSNAYIRDVLYGVACAYDIPTGFGCSRSKFEAITVENAGTAGFLTSDGATDNDFEQCTAIGTGTYGFRIRSSGNRIISPRCSGKSSAAISLDTTATDTLIENARLTGTGSPGTPTIGIDCAAADVKVLGGLISGHTTNCSVQAARFTAQGVTFRSATTDNVLVAVGGDDAHFENCRSISAASEGYQTRAARTVIRGGQSTGSGGLGFQSEASASDCRVEDVYMTGNTADFDDQGSNTLIVRRVPMAKSLNEAVASAANSANIDIGIIAATTVGYLIEADAEDSAGNRGTLRQIVKAYRSAAGGAAVGALTTDYTTAAPGLTINVSGSGNNLRVSVTNGMGNNARIDIKIWELWRKKTVEYS